MELFASIPLFSRTPILRFKILKPFEVGIGTSSKACSVRRLYRLTPNVNLLKNCADKDRSKDFVFSAFNSLFTNPIKKSCRCSS